MVQIDLLFKLAGLGVVVAVIRTSHDQQRLGRRNPVLGILNAVCKVYTTVIRGTPMMVQLLIWGFVIFKTSRNHTMVGALGLGINSGAYVAEIVRGGLVLQIREHTLVKDGQPVALTPTEFSLLQLFMKHPGQVFNRMQLLESTHGEAFDGYERTIDAHIRNLRRKIDEEPGMSRIETVYGIGYRFRGGM